MDLKNTPKWVWVREIMQLAIVKMGKMLKNFSIQCLKRSKMMIHMAPISKVLMVSWILTKCECKLNVNNKEKNMLGDVLKNLKKSFLVFIIAEKNMPLMPLEICTCVKNIMKLPKQKEIEKLETLLRNVVLKTTPK